jgi:Ulp1 family protease
MSDWTLYQPKGAGQGVPEQQNGCDCGVFTLTFANYLSEGCQDDRDIRGGGGGGGGGSSGGVVKKKKQQNSDGDTDDEDDDEDDDNEPLACDGMDFRQRDMPLFRQRIALDVARAALL